ncbi:DEAD/DEAH box helicase [Algivirga pacifica]|uniref:DEAD/DEAH box helicase n=1 Tax=Algivirga pacifica TaxID=1162670 RepID=A0ABP9DN40_9BACT
MKFERYQLDNNIVRALQEERMIRATDIQHKSIPHILEGEDLLAIAQTGTGKTAAYVIPILQKLARQRSRDKGIQALVMVPTRELAKQTAKTFQVLSKHLKIKTTAVFGGVEQDPQIDRLRKGTNILVATPGRMFDLKSQGYISFEQVETVVVDEADQMLDRGFLNDILQMISVMPSKRQTLFFSATIDKHIKKLAYRLVNQKAIRIQIAPEDKITKNVDHGVAMIDMDDKRLYLEQMVKANDDKRIIAFVRTKVRAERVQKAMERVGIEAFALHGGIEQKDREERLQIFREGKVKLLIATDVVARGIDVKGVEYVVNYDMPEVPENYVHRVGRTGRGEAKGVAISFCDKGELPLLQEVEELLDKKIARMEKDEIHLDNLRPKEEKGDWKAVMEEIQDLEYEIKEKKKKKKNRKKR